MTSLFDNLDWKQFERLCADILAAEGFIIESEPFVDRTGVDITASEIYRSHDPNRQIQIKWRVQCKHYSGSGKNLGRKEVEECLYSFSVNRGPKDGLLLMVDTDYTEAAKEVIDRHISLNPGVLITIWNQRQLATRLERHPHLCIRYGIPLIKADYVTLLSSLKRFGSVKTLFISDQSALAHNLMTGLRVAGFDLTFLPFWNYVEKTRMELNRNSVLEDDFELIVCFLGDSFVFPLPTALLETIERCHESGTALLLFPFLAWSLNRGLYLSLEKLIPVELQDPTTSPLEPTIKRISESYRRGDFRWMLSFDSFAEDQYTEFDPVEGQSPFTNEIKSRFGISHSFEYLTVKKSANLVWSDTTGNPMVIVDKSRAGKVCYLNTCGHSCMVPTAVSSPLEAVPQFAYLLRNILEWLLLTH
jgi:hypothetical protein